MNLVSVIIPVHNRFPLADESVGSVFNQTHRPIQLIIVDDCSDKPYTPKITSHPGFEVIIIRYERNQGPGASRETGRLAAKGNYIAYLDSDDLWHPEKLEKQVAVLKANPEAGMCYCQSLIFSDWPLTGNEPYRKNSNKNFENFLPIVLDTRPWCTSACMWTREASEIIGHWHYGWHYEDVVYDVKAGCNNIKIAYLPGIYCYYRLGNNGLSLSTTKNDFSFDQQVKSITTFTKELKYHQKINDNDIRHYLELRLYKTAIGALHRKKRKSARRLLKEIRLITKNSEKWFSSLFLSLASCFLPDRIISAINNRTKQIFYKL